MPTVNPTDMNIGDPNVVAQGVTEFKVNAGTATGGPYTASTTAVQVSAMTLAGSVYTVAMSALTWTPALANGTTYFAVAEGVSAGGTSSPSPEASFQIMQVPTAPQSLSFT